MESKRLLELLSKKLGISQAAIIELAVRKQFKSHQNQKHKTSK